METEDSMVPTWVGVGGGLPAATVAKYTTIFLEGL